MGGFTKIVRSVKRQVDAQKRTEKEREAASAKTPELIRLYLWSPEPDRKIFRSQRRSNPEKIRAGCPASSCDSMKSARSMHFPVFFKQAEEEREAASAMDPEIMELKFLEEQFAFKQKQNVSPREPGPFFFPGCGFSPEEERAVSPALSCDSMMSDDSMNYPMAF